MTSLISKKPLFSVGDWVRVVSPGLHRGKEGVVMEVVSPSAGDHVYRYHVRFSDALSILFFGFELQDRSSAQFSL
jgi:hypothetical protein